MAELEFLLTEDDYVAAHRLFKDRAGLPYLLLRLFMLALGLIFCGFALYLNLWWLAAAGIAYALLPWWWFHLVGVRLIRRNYRRYPAIHERQTLSVQDEAVVMRSALGETRLAWRMATGWAEGESMLLIYLQPKMFFAIPRQADPGGAVIATLREKLLAHVGQPR